MDGPEGVAIGCNFIFALIEDFLCEIFLNYSIEFGDIWVGYEWSVVNSILVDFDGDAWVF